MPIIPTPGPTATNPPPAVKWADATYYDVALANVTCAIIASGQYAPGPLITQLALAATAELMYQTSRWLRPTQINDIDLTPEEAEAAYRGIHVRGGGR